MSWYSSPFVRICSFLAKEKQRLRWPSNISQLLVQCTELRLRPNLEFCRVNDVAYISGPCRCWHFCLCWWLCVNNHLKICDYNKKEQQKMPGVFSFLAFFPQLFAVISFIFRDEHICPTSFSFTSIPVQQCPSWNFVFVRIVCDTVLRGQLLYFLTDKSPKTAVEKCTGGIMGTDQVGHQSCELYQHISRGIHGIDAPLKRESPVNSNIGFLLRISLIVTMSSH